MIGFKNLKEQTEKLDPKLESMLKDELLKKMVELAHKAGLTSMSNSEIYKAMQTSAMKKKFDALRTEMKNH